MMELEEDNDLGNHVDEEDDDEENDGDIDDEEMVWLLHSVNWFIALVLTIILLRY